MDSVEEKIIKIIDENSAKILALATYDLLKNNGEKAGEIKKSFVPRLTKETYIEYMNNITKK